MDKGQAKDDQPKVFLERTGIKHWYVLRSYKGHEISSPRRCGSDHEAIEWAKAFMSSWPHLGFECRLEEK